MKDDFYDGTKLLSLKDKNGEDPAIYICSGNRTAGKTVYFSRLVVNKFLKKKEQFILLYRFAYQLDNVENSFFQDIQRLFFTDYHMESKNIERGIIKELYLCKGDKKELCGYALALNAADVVKRYRALFVDCESMLFDEFQSESGKYCPNELSKFQSIYTTCSGRRTIKVYMISNAVSIINPYYITLGISHLLKSDTKFLKGEGFVLEHTFNAAAAENLSQNGFFKAFKKTDYSKYSVDNVYLNDNLNFVEKMTGQNTYICTLEYNKKSYGVRLYDDILYISSSADKTFKEKIALTLTDHGPESLFLEGGRAALIYCKKLFSLGHVRFENLLCKEAFFVFIGVGSM